MQWHRSQPTSPNTGPSAWTQIQALVLMIFLVGGGVWPRLAPAQSSVRLDTHVSTDSVAVGEQFTVSMTARHPRDTEVAFPESGAGPAVFGDVEVLRRSRVFRRRGDGETEVDSVAYTAATFALDSARVSAVPVQVAADGDTSVASAPARTMTVVSVVPPDAEGIHGVAPPAPFPRPLWVWILVALVGLGLLAGLSYLWWRRRHSPDAASPQRRPDPDQTPYEAATTWIRQLESYDLSDPDAVKPFYVELSTAVRVYLARELEVAALERTTREVVEALEARPDVPASAVTRIRAVLELADLVKFADARPSAADHERALREARTGLDTIEAGRPEAVENDRAVDGVASAA